MPTQGDWNCPQGNQGRQAGKALRLQTLVCVQISEWYAGGVFQDTSIYLTLLLLADRFAP